MLRSTIRSIKLGLSRRYFQMAFWAGHNQSLLECRTKKFENISPILAPKVFWINFIPFELRYPLSIKHLKSSSISLLHPNYK